jgi:hypothetical protein
MQRIKPAWDNYGKRPEIVHRNRLFKGFKYTFTSDIDGVSNVYIFVINL